MDDYIEYKNFLTSNISYVKIGGVIPHYFEVFTKRGLKKVFKIISDNNYDYYPIGGCSKILFPDKFMRHCLVKIAKDKILEKDEYIEVFAGTSLKKLSSYMINKGYQGFAGLIGIPGNVSGAIANNAGAFGDQIGNLILEVEVYSKNKFFWINQEKLQFSYRHSNIKKLNYIIYKARLKKIKGSREEEIEKARNNVKKRLNSQPNNVHTLGSTFKNSQTHSIAFELDRLGAKKIGDKDVKISTKHANFIINTADSMQKNFLNILVILRTLVYNKLEYMPELEIIVLRW